MEATGDIPTAGKIIIPTYINMSKGTGTAAVKFITLIGWDFPHLSQEQVNVFKMHGYTAAWIIPEGVSPEGRPEAGV